MIADGLRNHHKAGILITNTRPQQLGYSDTRKQQSRVFPLNPKSNLSFPMLRQGNRPLPRTSHPKQLCCSSMKQKHVSLHTNRADPRPQAGRCARQHTAESQLDMAHCSPQLYQRPERKSAFFAVAIQERLRGAYCAATSIKTSNPVLCHCHPSSLN